MSLFFYKCNRDVLFIREIFEITFAKFSSRLIMFVGGQFLFNSFLLTSYLTCEVGVREEESGMWSGGN